MAQDTEEKVSKQITVTKNHFIVFVVAVVMFLLAILAGVSLGNKPTKPVVTAPAATERTYTQAELDAAKLKAAEDATKESGDEKLAAMNSATNAEFSVAFKAVEGDKQIDLSKLLIRADKNGFAICKADKPEDCDEAILDKDGHVTGRFDTLEDGVLDFRLSDPEVEGQAFFHDKVGETVNRDFFANGENFGRVRVHNLDGKSYDVDFVFCSCDGTADQERQLRFTFDDDGNIAEMREYRVYNHTERVYTPVAAQ